MVIQVMTALGLLIMGVLVLGVFLITKRQETANELLKELVDQKKE